MHDALKEKPSFVIHREAHPGGHLRELFGVEYLAGEVSKSQPLRAETIKESPGTLVLEHPFHLPLQNRRLLELTTVGQGE